MSPEARNLYRSFETYLRDVNLPDKNRNTRAINPTETADGIIVILVQCGTVDRDLMNIMESYAPGRCTFEYKDDDLTGGTENRLIIDFSDETWKPQGDTMQRGGGFWSRMINEPKVVISVLVITLISASLTVDADKWRGLLEVLRG